MIKVTCTHKLEIYYNGTGYCKQCDRSFRPHEIGTCDFCADKYPIERGDNFEEFEDGSACETCAEQMQNGGDANE